MRRLGGVIFVILVSALGAVAEELRIQDPHGLTRALRQIDRRAAVVVTMGPTVVRAGAMLTNVNGLAGDIPARSVPEGYRFEGVGEGVWQITLAAPGEAVVGVRIETDG